jgi:hypothetical protein
MIAGRAAPNLPAQQYSLTSYLAEILAISADLFSSPPASVDNSVYEWILNAEMADMDSSIT